MVKKAILLTLDDPKKYFSKHFNITFIDKAIEILIKSGIKDLMILVSKNNFSKIIEYLGEGSQYKINICYKIQEDLRLKNSFMLCKSFTGRDSFVIMNGDNFFENSFEKELNSFLYKSYIFIKNETKTDLYVYTNHVYDVVNKFDNLTFEDINEYYCNKKDCGFHKVDGFWFKH